jgi:two-component system, chemotaxis family, protein-glutamate methylesterase/glutaminase
MSALRKAIRVLVVDDSAVVRQVMQLVLPREGDIEVTVALDPIIAMQKMQLSRPDVIVLDLEMPRMDGLTFLRRLMATDPIPVVICSGFGARGSEAALQALAEGAVEVVAKPQIDVRDFLHESATVLIDAVRAAAAVGPRPRAAAIAPRLTADAVLAPMRRPMPHPAATRIVAVAASTGGTQALETLLTALPADAPGLVIVQHMPAGFTGAFAERLNGISRVEVKEAATGDRVLDGRALLARGDRHLIVRRAGTGYDVNVGEGPLVSRHRPSADVLFRSVAQTAGPNALGIILTGMGGDGADGLLEMRQAGAFTVAQDEASCVVFGMPKEAILRGAVDQVIGLSGIAPRILRWATSPPGQTGHSIHRG